ncbi:MAG TPA: DUF5658 family protein [Phycisphaerales bacterium]|nr:DUF5658 family protein [Phycisphaerales bacterium]HMP38585.1 DUF5658 family protein [Phycisphaerales bacterium]
MVPPERQDATGAVEPAEPAGLHRLRALFPDEYVWFVFLSSLDIMLTWAILGRGGTEVNPVARLVIDRFGLPGAIVFKFSLTIFVIALCEVIGRRRRPTAHRLIRLCIVISAMPVAWSLVLLFVHTYGPA